MYNTLIRERLRILPGNNSIWGVTIYETDH